MSLIDQEIAPFHLNAYRNGEFVEVDSEDLRGRWNVIMFYPGDFTFVCPTELADLADHKAEIDALGVDLYSASTDSHFVHKAWHDDSDAVGKVTYTMLADMTLSLSRAFDVLDEEAGQAMRGTFLIDPDLKVRTIEIHDSGIGRDAKELLRKVKAAQYIYNHPGEVCPAHWEEGDATLSPSLDLVGKI